MSQASSLSSRRLIRLLVLCLGAGLMLPVSANVPDKPVERRHFEDAVVALEDDNLELFRQLAEKNRNYVLYPYLQYYELRKRVEQAEAKEIRGFLDKYRDLPFSSALRAQWLSHLAKTKNWSLYRQFYTDQVRNDLQCHHFTASLADTLSKKQLQQVLDRAEKQWLNGHKDRAECKPIFEALQSYGRITTALRWQRIELAMKVGNLKLAGQLSEPFGSRDKKLVRLWQEVYKKPEKLFTHREMRRNSLVKRKIAFHGIQRLAKRDVEAAGKLWNTAKRRFPFEKDQKLEMARFLALRAAYQSKPNALKLLKQLPQDVSDFSDKQLRARVALKHQNWTELMGAIKAMASVSKEAKWQYWQARAWEQLGQKDKAISQFERLATQTNYYGFLSADRVKKPYQITSEPLRRDEAALAMLRKDPGVQRTKELYALDRITEARREWNQVIAKLDENLTKLAALLAHDWQWHDNAILTVAKTGHRKDLNLRFPTPFRDLIYETAESYGLDPEWVYGVTRRESAFNTYARSSAGAMGLMQILPSTARIQSKSLGMAKPSYKDLFESERNIVLGSSYLNKMLQRFSGNQVVATAAYNAGPNRVSKWLPKDGDKVEADIWVDTIPYKETREYVRAVMAYAVIFEWRLNQTITPLHKRMENF
ncbi:MAG: lytic transglycosylase domain-containing protein [Gammaproteobacteria bacterium]|nr:lytic transglycosylase domain-containing protein [Gammaproteobacteria bacterium]MDH5802413.1 lytic transglycosylase domain-containing protein [Gammaproteobacteria bacterium]